MEQNPIVEENRPSLIESQIQKEPSLHRTRAMPFKTRASFRTMEKMDFTPRTLKREKFKRTWTRKKAKEKTKNEALSLQGDLKKERDALARAQVAMGMVKEVMAQVKAPHGSPKKIDNVLMARTTNRISQSKRKVFTQEKMDA